MQTKKHRVWLSALPSDLGWVKELAQDLQERLPKANPKTDVDVELGIPQAEDELCILVVTSAALDADATEAETLRTAWRRLAQLDGRLLLGLSKPETQWPPWMEQRVEHLLLDPTGGETYRIDLSAIISKYIGETEHDLGSG